MNQKDITEICVHEHKQVEGPTKALVAVVSLAVTLATMGAGAELGAMAVSGMGKGIAATTISGMTQGAFTALCSRSAVSLLENRGNVGHVLHDLISKESLKGFAKDALTTGLIGPGTHVSGVIPTLTQQLVRHAVKSAVGSAFGEKHAFRGFFKDVVVDTVGAVGADMIGGSYRQGDLNVISHKLAHAVLGGAMGYVIEGRDGVTPGAVSALASEALMELMMPDAPEMPKDGFKTKEDSERFEARVVVYQKQAQTIESVSRILIASGFLFTGHDPMLGDRIATNAIEHNFFGGVEERLASLFKKDRKEDEAFWQEQDKKVVECVTEHPDDILDGTQGLLTLASLYPPALPIAQVLQRVITGVRGVYKVGRVVEGEVAPTKIVVEDGPVVGKGLSKEQPWTIRDGQEWKAKVFGTGQKTGSEGHAFRSYREAIPSAKMESTESVHLNQGMNRVLGEPGAINPNRRPDVTIVRKDGRIDQVEVMSKTDREPVLMQRMEDTNVRLPQHQRGKVKVVEIKKKP